MQSLIPSLPRSGSHPPSSASQQASSPKSLAQTSCSMPSVENAPNLLHNRKISPLQNSLVSNFIRFSRSRIQSLFDARTAFIRQMPLVADFEVIFERDPATSNWLEALFCSPGLHAIASHRLAHWLHHRHVAFIPRFLSHLTRFCTGIEIHPGATLGKGVFIDHGMGVVIGETAIVGDYTLIYQGVTLGGTGKEIGKRHPTVGHHVVIGAGAKVLGNIHVGDNARIGAGSIVLNHVPSNCTAVGVPGRNICRSTAPDCPLDHHNLPDAQAKVTRQLLDRIEDLEKQVKFLMSL